MKKENKNTKKKISFDEALKILNIEDYKDRIWNSNSHGELFHLYDYVVIAQIAQEQNLTNKFREWFIGLVKWAEENWNRPESVFQHVPKLMYK